MEYTRLLFDKWQGGEGRGKGEGGRGEREKGEGNCLQTNDRTPTWLAFFCRNLKLFQKIHVSYNLSYIGSYSGFLPGIFFSGQNLLSSKFLLSRQFFYYANFEGREANCLRGCPLTPCGRRPAFRGSVNQQLLLSVVNTVVQTLYTYFQYV